VAVRSLPTEVLDQALAYYTLAKDYGLQDMYFATPSNREQTVQEEFHSYASGALSPQGTNILKYWEVRD
jgi:hypothetical protein